MYQHAFLAASLDLFKVKTAYTCGDMLILIHIIITTES